MKNGAQTQRSARINTIQEAREAPKQPGLLEVPHCTLLRNLFRPHRSAPRSAGGRTNRKLTQVIRAKNREQKYTEITRLVSEDYKQLPKVLYCDTTNKQEDVCDASNDSTTKCLWLFNS